MSTTLWVHGPLATDSGVTMWPAQRHERFSRIEVLRADDGYKPTQPSRIPVKVSHRGPDIGEVVHLEHRHGQLFAVAEIDIDKVDPATLPPRPGEAKWYWSAGTRQSPLADPYHVVDVELFELSLTTTPAVLGLRALQSTDNRPSRTSENKMLRRAADTIGERRHRYGVPLHIAHLDDDGKPVLRDDMPVVYRRPGGPCYSAPGRILSVR